MTDQSQFVDAYAIATGVKHRIPRIWLDDPIQGPKFAKTPSQRELDGDLPARPASDASAKEIDAFAEAADIDLTGIRKNDDKLVAIEGAMGPGPVQTGVTESETPAPVDDPLAPEKVAQVDPQLIAGNPVPAPAPDVDDEPEGEPAPAAYDGEEWSFQALKDEIDARNADRDEADQISKGGSSEDLRERLVEDDTAHAVSDSDADPDAVPSTPDTDTTSTDGTEPTDDTPAAGDKE